VKVKARVVDPVKLHLKLEQARAKQAKASQIAVPAVTSPVQGQFVAVHQVLGGQGKVPNMEIAILPKGMIPGITEGWQGYWQIEK
jgi:hypothetical protein